MTIIPLLAVTASLNAQTAANAAISASRHRRSAAHWRHQRDERIAAAERNEEIPEMTARSYTVAEIDRMRKDIEWSYPSGVPYYPSERSAQTERTLRTYMAAGVDPAELTRKRQELHDAEVVAQRHEREEWERQQQKLAAASAAQKAKIPASAVADNKPRTDYMSYVLAGAFILMLLAAVIASFVYGASPTP